jgi:predicted GIY-YIG superfamily endonuclease
MTKTYLYRLYNSSDELLYVGITRDLFSRLSTHRTVQSWWSEVDYYSVKEYRSRDEAVAQESYLIATVQPEYNQIPGKRIKSPELITETIFKTKRHIPLPLEEVEYLGSLNGDEAYARAAELRKAGWSLKHITSSMRVTPDPYSLRNRMRFFVNTVTGVPVPIPPPTLEEERKSKTIPRSYLTDREKEQIKEYATYSAKLRPEYKDDHPVVVKVNEYRVLVVSLRHRGVMTQDIAIAAGRNRNSIQKIYLDGLKITGEERLLARSIRSR